MQPTPPSVTSRGVDPRFDAALGGGVPSNPRELEAQRKRYSFLYDEVIPAERAALKQRLKVRPDARARMRMHPQQQQQCSVAIHCSRARSRGAGGSIGYEAASGGARAARGRGAFPVCHPSPHAPPLATTLAVRCSSAQLERAFAALMAILSRQLGTRINYTTSPTTLYAHTLAYTTRATTATKQNRRRSARPSAARSRRS